MNTLWPDRVTYVPEPVESAPMRDQICQRLEKLITEGRYRPGDRLPEPELARLFSVSRGPIREALQQMERDGWVEVKPRHGATVRRRSLKEISQLFDIRRVLEIHAARLATENLTDEGAKQLQRLMAKSHEAGESGDINELMAANWAVHNAIPALSGSEILANMIATLGRQVRWYTFTPASWERAPKVLLEHQAIVDAILAGDAEKAATLMDTHIGTTWHTYAKWIADKGLSSDAELAPNPES